MKLKSSVTFLFLCYFSSIYPQTVSGKLVDHEGKALSGVELILYISSKSFNTISGSDGNFIVNDITGINAQNELPEGYRISDNFPNPFNPATRIIITLSEPKMVKLEVFNILGKRVLDVNETFFLAGNNIYDIVLDGMPNGIYFAKFIIDGKHFAVRKLLLLYGSKHIVNYSHSQISYLHSSEVQRILLSTKLDSLIAIN